MESINSNRPMLACNHEEAITHIVVHVMHALEKGMKTVLVRTVNTDVIVILVGVFVLRPFNLQQTSGLPLAQAKAILFTAFFTFVPVLGTINHKHCLCSMHSQVVTLLHHSGVKARSQPGMHGRPVTKLQKHSYIWLVTI